MNTRERSLAIILLGVVIVIAGGFGAMELLAKPLRERDVSIGLLREEIDKRRQEVAKIQAEKAKLARWRQMSLPADTDLASREYEKFIGDLLRQSKFAADASTVKATKESKKSGPTVGVKKEPVYTKLLFTIETQGDVTKLVRFLEKFYHTGLLHQVKKLSIQKPRTASANQRPNDLDIRITIEALALEDADNRPYLPPVDPKLLVAEAVTTLRHGPMGLALAADTAGPAGPLGGRHLAIPARQYASIAGKDIFFGPPPAVPVETVSIDRTDVTQFVFLTDITQTSTKTEAFLFDQYNNRRMRLLVSAGFDTFRIRDAQGDTLVSGKVVKIEDRDVIFLAREKYYSLHVGHNLKQALATPLGEEELQKLGIKTKSPSEKKPEPEPGPDPE